MLGYNRSSETPTQQNAADIYTMSFLSISWENMIMPYVASKCTDQPVDVHIDKSGYRHVFLP